MRAQKVTFLIARYIEKVIGWSLLLLESEKLLLSPYCYFSVQMVKCFCKRKFQMAEKHFHVLHDSSGELAVHQVQSVTPSERKGGAQ